MNSTESYYLGVIATSRLRGLCLSCLIFNMMDSLSFLIVRNRRNWFVVRVLAAISIEVFGFAVEDGCKRVLRGQGFRIT